MELTFSSFLLIYLVLVNLCPFLIMFADKKLARQGGSRVPEATLLFFCAVGGSLGGLAAMYLFRHKTRHPKFTIGVPLILVLQLILAAILVWRYVSLLSL